MDQDDKALSLAPVVPCADLGAAVEAWSALLGTTPTFVDGDRWAQFDLPSGRLALAGTDQATAAPSVMVKVAGVEHARERAAALGLTVGEIEEGPHERRCVVRGPSGWDVVFYSPA
ncbi:VOC family protein [Microbispora sp. H11081]|uniref:VOC family protein n=1 Tax=Microbispora sp. H11081 TaxID=2729107 RepID=UPI0014746937|nr:VOC family protein [Microbispora sp. H11081]